MRIDDEGEGRCATYQSYAQHALTASAHQEAHPFLHLTPAPAGILEEDVASDLLSVDTTFSAVEPWPVEDPEDETPVGGLPEEGAPETCSAAAAGAACPTFTSTFECADSIGTSSYSTTHSSSPPSYLSNS